MLNNPGAAFTSYFQRVNSVGSKITPLRVDCTGNTATLQVWGAPTPSTAFGFQLGTIAASGGSLVIDEPVEYIYLITDNAEAGNVQAFLNTSR